MRKARNAFVVAIVALFIMGSGLGHSQQPQQQPYRSAESEQNAEPHQERPTEIVPLPQLLPPDNLQDDTREDGHESPDERSEFWVIFGHRTKITDFWLAVFTGLLVLVGTGQTYWLWRTVTDGNKQHVVVNRAFVLLDGFNVELTTAADFKSVDIDKLPERYKSDPSLYITRFAVSPRWRNSGNTPTRKMTYQVNWRGPPGPIPPDYVYSNPPEPFFLAHKAVEPSALVEIPRAPILIDWALRRIGEEPGVYIWGRADYEDIFGESHFVQWCRQLRFERHDGEKLRAGFIQWGEYNRSDEDNRA
jgi:hypothetical protein